jgi:hypothetical protein
MDWEAVVLERMSSVEILLSHHDSWRFHHRGSFTCRNEYGMNMGFSAGTIGKTGMQT